MIPKASEFSLITERLREAREASADLIVRVKESRDRVDVERRRRLAAGGSREVMRETAYGRLLLRFESQAVIEQAKGVIMAERRCTPDEAFETLKEMSQHRNVRLRLVAAEIVDLVSSGGASRTEDHPAPSGS